MGLALNRKFDGVVARIRSAAGVAQASVRSVALGTLAYWWFVGALIVSMALWLAAVFESNLIPPGGDPGNWVATSYMYTGHPYASQLVPYGYPPLLFPILAVFILPAGPVSGIQLFAPVLLGGLGLSIAYLSRAALKSAVTAGVAVALLVMNPSLLDMFFWGAYPNLLAFAFLNVSLVGLLTASRGHPSSGAFQFWVFGAATILTHSLTGLVWVGTMVVFVTLSATLPPPPRPILLEHARRTDLEDTAVGAWALWHSRGGLYGALFCLVMVGGFYGGTFATGVPHPAYFASSSAEFGLIPRGAFFQALLPHLFLSGTALEEVLIVLVVLGVAFFAFLRDSRPEWLTPTVVLLLAWNLAVVLLAVAGISLRVATDYRRFGFMLLIPSYLGAAYFAERAWVLRHRTRVGVDVAETRGTEGSRPDRSSLRGRWERLRHGPQRRPAALAFVGVVAVLLLATFVTGPALNRDEATFTRGGHDAGFLEAVGAIVGSGISGAILTLPAEEKWTRALTNENTYAPDSPLYLYYPSQAVTSELAAFALDAHYSLTNGRAIASVHAVNPANAEGVPEYGVFLAGEAETILRLAPDSVRLVLYDPGNGTTITEGLSGGPTVSFPSSVVAPMTLSYTGAGFTLGITVLVNASSPEISVNVTARTSGPYTLESLSFLLEPAPDGSAYVAGVGGAGNFEWQLLGPSGHPMTYGSVTPSAALQGVTNYDPTSGGPAVHLESQGGGSSTTSRSVSLSLQTPGAGQAFVPTPSALEAPWIWQDLGIRFALVPTAPGATGEATYLAQEYGLSTLFANSEWTVLSIPTYST